MKRYSITGKLVKIATAPAAAVIFGLVVFIYQLVFQIVPARMVLSQGVMARISPILAVTGLFLFMLAAATDPKRFQRKELVIPCLIILVLCASSALNHSRGLTDNIKTVIWQIDLLLFIFPTFIWLGNVSAADSESNSIAHYPSDQRRCKICQRAVRFAVVTALLIWDVAVLISLVQFFMMMEYKVIPKEGGLYIQGLSEGRLFGIFTNPYNSAIISFYASTVAVCMASYSRGSGNQKLKTFSIISFFLSTTMIVLSGTRCVMLGIIISCTVIVTVLILENPRICCHIHSCSFRAVIAVILAIIVSAGVFMLLEGYGKALRYGNFALNEIKEDSSVMPLDANGNTNQNSLERTDVNGDISNNRFAIWKDYLYVFMNEPAGIPFGYSPGGYMEYIDKNYPDLYIVQYIKAKYPFLQKSGRNIYGTHNSVLTVMISTGVVGLALLAALIIDSLIHIAKCFQKRRPQVVDYCMLAVLLTTAVALMFESDIFYQCSATSVVFWMVLGAVFGCSISNRTLDNFSQIDNKGN